MSEPKNDAAPADVQKPTDQDLIAAVIKAASAYNQHVADAKASAFKLETDCMEAIGAAEKAGLSVNYALRGGEAWRSPFNDIRFSRTIELTPKKGDA